MNEVDPLGQLGCSSFGFLGLSSDCSKAVAGAKLEAHEAVHVADNVRHFVAAHRRGLEQVGIAVAAVGLTIATAGADTPILATLAIGASASLASYGAGCLGVSGSNGCSVKGALIAAAAGALGAGIASGANAIVAGSVGRTFLSKSLQYSSIGVLSSAISGGSGTLVDDEWENKATTWGQIWSDGLGSLGGVSDHG